MVRGTEVSKAQHQWNHEVLDTGDGFTDVAAEANTFLISQAALLASHAEGASGIVIDLNFAQEPTTGSFQITDETTQVYLYHSYGENIKWSLGKFDGLIGFESNDVKDLFFNSWGLVSNELPSTHTGLLMDFSIASFSFSFIVANSNQANLHTDTDLQKEVVMNFTYTQNNWAARAGFLVNTDNGEYTAGGNSEEFQNESVAELAFGIGLGSTSIDLALYSFQHKEAKLSDGTDRDSSGGVFIHIAHELSEKWQSALRLEKISDKPIDLITSAGGSGNDSEVSKLTLGLNKRMSDALLAKFEIANSNLTAGEGADKVSFATAAVGVLHEF
jgi:hypothetical protein